MPPPYRAILMPKPAVSICPGCCACEYLRNNQPCGLNTGTQHPSDEDQTAACASGLC